jgi:hypothetical protein
MPTEKTFCARYQWLERMYIKNDWDVLEEMKKHHPDIAGTPCRACLDTAEPTK